MNLDGKVVAVTGAARGIGFAIAHACHQQGAKLAIADLVGAQAAAKGMDGIGMSVDVTQPGQIAGFIDQTEAQLGPIDVYVSNAGILQTDAPSWDAAGADDDAWQRSFDVNVLASVRSARYLWPGMRERGGGVFVIVASAAGLLSQIGAAPYTASKHAAVAFAESLAIAHADDGLQVVCVCPQAVRTPMLGASTDGGIAGVDGVLEPEEVARATLQAITDKKFLVLPHPQVAKYETARSGDRDRWLQNMRSFRRKIVGERGQPV